MFCALHVVVAFGVLLVVCSLVRANAVAFEFSSAELSSESILHPSSVSQVFSLLSFFSLFFPLKRAKNPNLLAHLQPQFSGPAVHLQFFFSLLPSPRVLASFSPAVGTRCCLHLFHVALSVCRACLGEVPAWFFPFL